MSALSISLTSLAGKPVTVRLIDGSTINGRIVTENRAFVLFEQSDKKRLYIKPSGILWISEDKGNK